MNKYREDVLDKKPYIDWTCCSCDKSYQEHKKPNVLKRAYMLKEILENISLYIEDETILLEIRLHLIKDAPIFQSILLEFVPMN